MSSEIDKFIGDWQQEHERLTKVWLDAEKRARAVGYDDESQKVATDAWAAMLRHMGGEGLEPPEGWHLLRQ